MLFQAYKQLVYESSFITMHYKNVLKMLYGYRAIALERGIYG